MTSGDGSLPACSAAPTQQELQLPHPHPADKINALTSTLFHQDPSQFMLPQPIIIP